MLGNAVIWQSHGTHLSNSAGSSQVGATRPSPKGGATTSSPGRRLPWRSTVTWHRKDGKRTLGSLSPTRVCNEGNELENTVIIQLEFFILI